ncbi:uncharacterized protein LOC108667786 [Hyalella azteca]|uniref:Uncharacterized protein LOC108667786 n=1 Tax=Hyalella azteca TaxID=294128 RepID=A0A979FP97_HYAAZ|nr:uncharacterized protein LOC108667786 [Hyalella azteca]
MSLPSTPIGVRRRSAANNQASGWGGRESPTAGAAGASWLGQLGGIVGDILQGWGLLGALRKTSTASNSSRSSPSYGWGSFGGVGGGLGAAGGLGCYSSPSSPLVANRNNGLSLSRGEHIELLPIGAQCVISAGGSDANAATSDSLATSASVVKLRRRRPQSCPRHQGRPARHSYHEGSAASSYLLTSVLMHSLKHGVGQSCQKESNCHICNNVPYDQLQTLMAGKKFELEELKGGRQQLPNLQERSCESIEDDLGEVVSCPADGSAGASQLLVENSRVKSLIVSSDDEFSDSCTNCNPTEYQLMEDESDSIGLSDISYHTARDGTFSCSGAEGCSSGLDLLVSSHSLTDGHTDTYPADTLTEGRDGSDDSDDTLYGHDDESQERSCDLNLTPVASPMKLVPRKLTMEKPRKPHALGSSKSEVRKTKRPNDRHSVASFRPSYRSVVSHDGTVSSGNRSSSLSSLTCPSRGQPFFLHHRGHKHDMACKNLARHGANDESKTSARFLQRSEDGTVDDGMRLLHRKCCVVSGAPEDDVSSAMGGAVIMWPLRRSFSTSPTQQSSFGWEEVRYRCDACAHLVFTAPVTCRNCGYTCHEQCRPLVAIDCRARHTPEPDATDETSDISYPVTPSTAQTTSANIQTSKSALNQTLESAQTAETNTVAPPDQIPDIEPVVNQATQIRQLSNDLNSDMRAKPDGCESDEDDSSDYATLRNDHPLTRGSMTINDGLSTLELQQHLMLCNDERSSGHGSMTAPVVEKEKHEAEQQEKDLVNGTSFDSASLRHAIQGLCVEGEAPAHLESWLLDSAAAQGLQLSKEDDGSYRGCLRVHLNLSRPINIVAGTRPPSIYDILKEDRTLDKTLTSFYMPRNAVKAIHITSKTTTREVIVALLRKFKVVDNPQKFALYERSFESDATNGTLRRISDAECPLVLAMQWSAEGLTAHRIVLQENDTADIQWDAFSLTELSNFLRILAREEEDYRSQILDKYARIRGHIRERLAAQP